MAKFFLILSIDLRACGFGRKKPGSLFLIILRLNVFLQSMFIGIGIALYVWKGCNQNRWDKRHWLGHLKDIDLFSYIYVFLFHSIVSGTIFVILCIGHILSSFPCDGFIQYWLHVDIIIPALWFGYKFLDMFLTICVNQLCNKMANKKFDVL